MSVDLNKKGNKVNLSKEPVAHRNIVSLTKASIVNNKGEISETSFDSQVAAPYATRGFRLWYLIPGAVVLLILIVAAIVKKSTITEADNPVVAEFFSQEDSVGVMDGAVESTTDLVEKQEGSDDIAESGQVDDIESNTEITSDEAASAYIDDSVIHRYEVITADVTWEEAFQECINRGGYLCRINSNEENEVIKSLLNENNVRWIVYLGGLRDSDSQDYHWIDENKQPFNDVINADNYLQYWYSGEPSYIGNVNDEVVQECYMSIIYVSSLENWVWNDVNNDVLALAPNYYAGRLSYICEYE